MSTLILITILFSTLAVTMFWLGYYTGLLKGRRETLQVNRYWRQQQDKQWEQFLENLYQTLEDKEEA